MIFAVNAMSTIPSIFDEHPINRTLIGGGQINPHAKFNAAAILLNSTGSHLKPHLFDTLLSCGFKCIVSVEPPAKNYNIEDFSRRYPGVRFLLPQDEATDGELINLSISELDTEYFLVLRDTLNITGGLLLKNMFDTLTQDKPYCIAPRLFSGNGEPLPVRIQPVEDGKKFTTNAYSSISNGAPTLLPRDFIALYNRAKFIELGGFDYTIASPYYQNADLALRAWLWGERTVLSTAFRISYAGEAAVDDITANLSSLRFYLKNILPRRKDFYGVIPIRAFFNFFFQSSCGFFEALRQFKEARQWVEKNKFRFRTDIAELIKTWGVSS